MRRLGRNWRQSDSEASVTKTLLAVLAAILLGGLIGVAQYRTAERAQMLSCINTTEATDTDAEVCEKISQHRRMIGR